MNSTWNTAFNEFRVTYQRQRDLRNPGQPFPHVQVDISGDANVRLGAELSSQQNRLDQDVVEVTDDFTWLKGTHTFTFGTHNEFFKFLNVFVQNYYGQYRFSSIDNFAAGIAGRLQPQLLEYQRPDPAGAVRGEAVRRLCRGSVAREGRT